MSADDGPCYRVRELYPYCCCTVYRLRKTESIEEGVDNLLSIPNRHNSCCSPRAAAMSVGRSRQPALIADHPNRPMCESTGRRRSGNNNITVVYASHLYCTLKHPSPRKGDTAYVPPSHPRGDRVYNSTSKIGEVAQ